MQKKVIIRTPVGKRNVIKRFFDEATSYLSNFNFTKVPIAVCKEGNKSLYIVMFKSIDEKILIQCSNTGGYEEMNVTFDPLNSKLIYDVLYMRFQQIAKYQPEVISVISK